MARSMFRDVVDPSIHVGENYRYTLPLTIVVHFVFVGTLIVLPLLAPAVLPAPARAALLVFAAARPAALPPPPPSAPVHAARIERSNLVSDTAAPFEAPINIAPEQPALENAHQLSVIENAGNAIPAGEIGIPGGSGPPPPPRAEAPPPVVRVGGQIRPPTKTKDVKPIYPVIARAVHLEGIVIIEATIGPTGKVQDARVLQSHPLLEVAALDAVRQWEFTPTLLNGSPVSVVITVTVDFRLR